MLCFVYVLRSKQRKMFYKGITSNLDKRIHQHELGQCQTTRNMMGFDLVFVQICENRKEARGLEKLLKSGYGREIIGEIV